MGRALRVLSVRPSVCPVRTRSSKTQKRRKIKIGINVSQGMSKWSANFQPKRSKTSRSPDVKKPSEIAEYLEYMWGGG